MSRGRLALLTALLALGAVAVAPAGWSAEPPTTPAAAFYTPPELMPGGRPGDVIRSEPIPTLLSVLARTTRIMYRSSDTHGQPIAATGIVLDPVAPWLGPGQRPLVGFTVGTHGQGDQCAPSKLLAEGAHYSPPLDAMIEYEVAFIADHLSQGMAVVVPDYQGLGTPDVHTYLNRVAEAHADVDAVRAAQRLPGTGIPADGPVGFSGYSQGGQASAAAAELVGSYGSELTVVGTYAGAPPRDVDQTFRYADGSSLTGAFGYYLNGLKAAYPETRPVLDAALNDAGGTLLSTTSGQCVPETLATYGLHRSNEYTVSGRSIPDVLASHPATRAAVARDRLGDRTPSRPVLLATGNNDDVVPPEGVRSLARAWCARGATVELAQLPLPTLARGTGIGHIANSPLASITRARTWLQDRFAGKPAPSTCGAKDPTTPLGAGPAGVGGLLPGLR